MEKRQSRRLSRRHAGLLALLAAAALACEPRVDRRTDAPGAPSRAVRAAGPPTIALALSGGGYRATLHGLAALQALDSFGLLDQVRVVSGVSGGSLTAGYYAYYRARHGESSSFEGFKTKMMHAIGTYEVPRSVLAAELLTTGNDTAETLARCAGQNAVTMVRGFGNFQKAVRKCAGRASLEMAGTSVLETIDEFAGEVCKGDGQAAIEACVDRGPDGLGARVTATLVAVALGEDLSHDMQRSFCSLALQQCSDGDSARPDSRHPFADLLHLALFEPWQPGQPVVRMKDLETAGLTVLINAASNTHGELWTASQRGAGIRRALPGRLGTWRGYARGSGPALADAVAASACHPLFCRPIRIPWGGGASEGTLTDGGIHDNLGVVAIQELLEHERFEADLLVIADAHRPYTGTENPTSRVDTVFRVHDLLIDQQSAATVRRVKDDGWPGRCAQPVYVSLIEADPKDEPLSRLPTDLRPIREPAAEILGSAVHRFKRELSRNHCVDAWLRARRPGRSAG